MEPVAVRVGDCACPDSPHADGDEVYLSPTVPLRLGLAAERLFVDLQTRVQAAPERRDAFSEDVEDSLVELYLRYAVVGWNLEYLNGKGVPEPRPFDVRVLLDDWTLARSVADKADDLYSQTLMRPFQATQPKPSPPGLTADTTSPAGTSTRSRRKRSSRSTSAGAR